MQSIETNRFDNNNGIRSEGTPTSDTIGRPAASACLRLTVDESVEALIHDARPFALGVFTALSPDQFKAVAFDAWNIGLTALANAMTQSREARLDEVGRRVLDDLEGQLEAFINRQREAITTSLAAYFDPQTGEFSRRVASFVADDGDLQRALAQHVGANGTLARTLAQHLGENSPLLRRLSPSESDGLVKVLEARLTSVLAAEHNEFVRALDPLAPDGAVARFLNTLRDDVRKTDEDRAKQLRTATMALDANDPQSLISRFLAQSQTASKALLNAVNPDAAGSAMSIIRATLVATLQSHFTENRERLDAQEKRQVLFQQQVTDALARMEGARERDRRNPIGGFDFQDQVLGLIQRALGNGPYIAEKTANIVGLRRNCKVGDQVVRFTKESAFHGAVLVVEAKRDAKFTLAKAVDEMAVARANRGATAGLFVMAASHAPPDFPPFTRHGEDVFVVWDVDDPLSEPYLHAALLLALSLASRRARPLDTGRIDALATLEGCLEVEHKRLETMKKCNEKIREGSEKLTAEIEKGLWQFRILIRKGRETLAALDISTSGAGEEPALLFEPLLAANDSQAEEFDESNPNGAQYEESDAAFPEVERSADDDISSVEDPDEIF